MKFSEKAALATGTISLAAVPMAADAAVVHVVQSVSIRGSDLFHGPDFDLAYAPWDIDGDSGYDFYLVGYRDSGSFQIDSSTSLRYQYGIFGILNWFSTSLSPAPNGNSLVVTSSSDGLARLRSSDRVGPTLSPGQYGAPAGAALVTYETTFWTFGGSTYGGSSQIPEGSLHSGRNNIGFRFIANGNTHYGYADLTVINGSDPGIEISQWWYEDEPDTEIHVTPVPSSGVAALTLLGLGAAGLRAQRKHKATHRHKA